MKLLDVKGSYLLGSLDALWHQHQYTPKAIFLQKSISA
jgi:hypothetical protein